MMMRSSSGCQTSRERRAAWVLAPHRRSAARILALAVAALMLTAGCGAGAQPAAPDGGDGSTEDRVTAQLRPGPQDQELEYTLICGDQPEVQGDHGSRVADPALACEALSASADRLILLTATPEPDEICTEIYGGDQQATITGTVEGQAIEAELSRVNGCRIADWDALLPLLGPGGV
ncbi:MAG TPA: hypothetical protein VML96_04455 [Egibacteraceae bacterium]|nr:hypothetical protein [Egibacteraceae bacterium]